jgi:hypothetical protein
VSVPRRRFKIPILDSTHISVLSFLSLANPRNTPREKIDPSATVNKIYGTEI